MSVMAASLSTGLSLPPRWSLKAAYGKESLNDFPIEDEAVIAIMVAVAEISESLDRIIDSMANLVGELIFESGRIQEDV